MVEHCVHFQRIGYMWIDTMELQKRAQMKTHRNVFWMHDFIEIRAPQNFWEASYATGCLPMHEWKCGKEKWPFLWYKMKIHCGPTAQCWNERCMRTARQWELKMCNEGKKKWNACIRKHDYQCFCIWSECGLWISLSLPLSVSLCLSNES